MCAFVLLPAPEEINLLNNRSYHLSATVPVKSVQYLEWLGLEAWRTGGLRLSKAAIVRALLNVAMRMDIDVAGVTNQAELEERIWAAMGGEGRKEGREEVAARKNGASSFYGRKL